MHEDEQSSNDADRDCLLEDESAPISFTVPVGSESPLPDFQPHPFHFHHQNEPEFQSKQSHLVSKLVCSTCNAHKCSFYCFSCVNRGEFTSSQSSQVLKEKFSEKKFRLFTLQEEKKQSLQLIENLLQPCIRIDLLQSQVNQQTVRNQKLKACLEGKQKSLHQMIDRKVDIRLVQQQARQLRDLNCRKVASAQKAIQQIGEKLRSSIFTLESYDPEESDASSSNAESVPLLGYSSAARFTPAAKRNETKYTIVEPWLPAAPAWSSYSSWVVSHKEEIGSTASFDSLEKKNDAFRISAALSYIAHMTDVLSRVLDLHLPRKLSFKEFYTKSSTAVEEFLTETQLRHKVAKLDANVAFLCLSQKVDPNLISTRQAVQNLINLLNPSLESDLGRRGPIPVDPEFALSISILLGEDLSLVQEEPDADCEYDPQFDVDELGYEAIPLWGHDGAHELHDQSMMQANSMLSPASVLSFFDVSRFWAPNNP